MLDNDIAINAWCVQMPWNGPHPTGTPLGYLWDGMMRIEPTRDCLFHAQYDAEGTRGFSIVSHPINRNAPFL